MARELSPSLLISAYAQGMFPMGYEGEIYWFCPDPRAIIEPDRFHVPRTLRQLYRQGKFTLTVDRDFQGVIDACADRPEGTWILREIRRAYLRLHELGYAHSVEAWRDGQLAGGLYGVAIGGVFCGESMFHHVSNASKIALVYLMERMRERGFVLLDIQFTTPHLEQFNCVEIPRREYLQRLEDALKLDCSFAD